ncbi:MAG: hypothetical protein ABEK01_00475 [Candidatus Nanohaloarchaea archaeon]
MSEPAETGWEEYERPVYGVDFPRYGPETLESAGKELDQDDDFLETVNRILEGPGKTAFDVGVTAGAAGGIYVMANAGGLKTFLSGAILAFSAGQVAMKSGVLRRNIGRAGGPLLEKFGPALYSAGSSLYDAGRQVREWYRD